MNDVPEMDIHHVWCKWSNPVDLLPQCFNEQGYVTNLHLKYSAFRGPRVSGEHHEHLNP